MHEVAPNLTGRSAEVTSRLIVKNPAYEIIFGQECIWIDFSQEFFDRFDFFDSFCPDQVDFLLRCEHFYLFFGWKSF